MACEVRSRDHHEQTLSCERRSYIGRSQPIRAADPLGQGAVGLRGNGPGSDPAANRVRALHRLREATADEASQRAEEDLSLGLRER
jgi:hypothetical protein